MPAHEPTGGSLIGQKLSPVEMPQFLARLAGRGAIAVAHHLGTERKPQVPVTSGTSLVVESKTVGEQPIKLVELVLIRIRYID